MWEHHRIEQWRVGILRCKEHVCSTRTGGKTRHVDVRFLWLQTSCTRRTFDSAQRARHVKICQAFSRKCPRLMRIFAMGVKFSTRNVGSGRHRMLENMWMSCRPSMMISGSVNTCINLHFSKQNICLVSIVGGFPKFLLRFLKITMNPNLSTYFLCKFFLVFWIHFSHLFSSRGFFQTFFLKVLWIRVLFSLWFLL